MRSRTHIVDNGRERSLVLEVPRGISRTTRPDQEVPERAKRRRFTAQYKLRILEEAEACREPGSKIVDRGLTLLFIPRRKDRMQVHRILGDLSQEGGDTREGGEGPMERYRSNMNRYRVCSGTPGSNRLLYVRFSAWLSIQ